MFAVAWGMKVWLCTCTGCANPLIPIGRGVRHHMDQTLLPVPEGKQNIYHDPLQPNPTENCECILGNTPAAGKGLPLSLLGASQGIF